MLPLLLLLVTAAPVLGQEPTVPSFLGPGWTRVRHNPGKRTGLWHPATDDCKGTNAPYGDPNDDSAPWTVQWTNSPPKWFLLASDNFRNFVVISNENFNGWGNTFSGWIDSTTTVEMTSVNCESHPWTRVWASAANWPQEPMVAATGTKPGFPQSSGWWDYYARPLSDPADGVYAENSFDGLAPTINCTSSGVRAPCANRHSKAFAPVDADVYIHIAPSLNRTACHEALKANWTGMTTPSPATPAPTPSPATPAPTPSPSTPAPDLNSTFSPAPEDATAQDQFTKHSECAEHRTMQEIAAQETSATFLSGGMGRMKTLSRKFWGCFANHSCLGAVGANPDDWMCYIYDESQGAAAAWVPWGLNSELGVVTGSCIQHSQQQRRSAESVQPDTVARRSAGPSAGARGDAEIDSH